MIKPRGRPKDPAKRSAILEAALGLFRAHGPEVVTMDALVAASGVSRMTVYSHFKDKAAVLEAVVLQLSSKAAPDDFAHPAAGLGVEANLTEFGVGVVEFLFSAGTWGMERLVAAAVERQPALAERLYAAGPGRAHGLLCDLIGQHIERGNLKPTDAAQAATDLLGLWQGFIRQEISYLRRAPLNHAQAVAQAQHGVDLFLMVHRAPPKTS